MLRTALLSAALMSSFASAAFAQSTGGPPIAYVKVAGNANELYLVNQDGSGLRKLHSVKGKGITALDMRPGGNQLAFVERSSGSPSVLKILNYDDSGLKQGEPVSVPGLCGPDYVDYNPVPSTPPELLVSGYCASAGYIARVRTDGSGYTVLQTGSADLYASQGRWASDGTGFYWVRSSVPNVQQLCRDACDPSAGQMLWSGQQVTWNDVGRIDNTILFNSGFFVQRLNGDTGAIVQENFIRGDNAHFSPTHRYVVYRTLHQASGDYLHILDTSSALAPRLTGKGTYGPVDWRK